MPCSTPSWCCFLAVSQLKGLSYAELNIVVYCELVPPGWLVVVVLRHPRYQWLLLTGTWHWWP